MRECRIFLNCFILISLVFSVWTQTSDACGGMLKSSEGVITSPGYPDVYPNNQLCIWEIKAAPELSIALIFTHFHLEDNINCTFDRVSIFSRSSENSGWSHEAMYCGSKLPFVYVSKGNVLRLEFRSDGSREESGFSVFYSSYSGIENANGATYSTDVSIETTEQPTENVPYQPEYDYSTENVPYQPELDDYANRNVLNSPEKDWYTSETQSITPLSQNPLPHPVSGPVVSTLKPTDGCFDETGPALSKSNAGSAVLPILLKYLLQSQSARETSPVSDTALDPKYLPASPRNYIDISINFPFGQRWSARDTPLPTERRPTQNQGMGSVPDYLKSKPSSAQSERGYDRFSVDTQNRNVRKSDEELSSRYADVSYSQNDYVPRPLMALFLFSNSYPTNIRVNG